jgi:predicted phosphoribosyltransferase/dienelactone hydrolase
MGASLPFRDRRDAGDRLAGLLTHLAPQHPIVLALPRGGVPVAARVASLLEAPLDILVVRKLGLPSHPELAMGAIGEDGARVLERTVLEAAAVTPQQLARVEADERAEIERRAHRYRDGRPAVPIAGRVVVIVDDGIATGSTALAAIQIARHRGAARVVLAAPVAAAETARELASVVDELICVATPADFVAVGQFYENFSQTSDEEVTALLAQDARRVTGGSGAIDDDVVVVSDGVSLDGHLTVPAGARGVVLFAHGSGSSARSPRNQRVASQLCAGGLGTLLFDLLTPEEAADRANVFDIGLLARRLAGATRWLRDRSEGDAPSIGYFGASTGAGAALVAAADPALGVDAVVSRGGRVDLAGPLLGSVRAPTLMIVGSADSEVLALNRAAADRLRCEHEIVVVPGASHLFEEPGALDAVAAHARRWFERHLGGEPVAR